MNTKYLASTLLFSAALTACSSKSTTKDSTSAATGSTVTGTSPGDTSTSTSTSTSTATSSSTAASTAATVAIGTAVKDITGTAIVSGQGYFIRNVGSNHCVDLQNGTLGNGGVVQGYDCIPADQNQIWVATVNSDGTLSFLSSQASTCLDLPAQNIPAENNPYQTWGCTGVNNQSFSLTVAAHGGYQFANADSLFQCLTDGGADTSPETAVTCAGTAAQAFMLIPSADADPAGAAVNASGSVNTTCVTASGAGQIPSVGLSAMSANLLAATILVTSNTACDAYCDAYNATTCVMAPTATSGQYSCSPLNSSGTVAGGATNNYAVACTSN